MDYPVENLSETREVVRKLITSLQTISPRKSALVVGLEGELGTGKTAFVREFVSEIGRGAEVTSPTFILMQKFPISENDIPFTEVVHIDAYRIEDPEELLVLSWEELIKNPRNLIFVEWPERVETILPPDALAIHFEFKDDGTRTISLPDLS